MQNHDFYLLDDKIEGSKKTKQESSEYHHHHHHQTKTGSKIHHEHDHPNGDTITSDDSFSTATWPSITVPSSLLLPRYNHILSLFATLILSASLAFLAALDATFHCTKGTDAWTGEGFFSSNFFNNDDIKSDDTVFQDDQNNYNNDDNHDAYYDYQRDAEVEGCKSLMIYVMIPVCPLAILLSIISCQWTLQDDRRWNNNNTTSATTKFFQDNQTNTQPVVEDIPAIPESISMMEVEDPDKVRLQALHDHVQYQSRHLYSCYKLLIVAFIVLALWTFAHIAITGQSDQSVFIDSVYYGYNNQDDNNNNNINNYYQLQNNDQNSVFKVDFISLGAVNTLGEVGQNANLYYTSWISLGICMALVYELARMTIVQYKTTQNLNRELHAIKGHMEGETTSIETILTWTRIQKAFIKESRSTWYNSLYKLRLRTGIWVSTCIASLVIFASSTRVWRNSILPALQMAEKNDENINTDNYVCDILAGYLQEQNAIMSFLNPSKCNRTKASQIVGILCISLSCLALFSHFRVRTEVARVVESSSRLLNNMKPKEESLERNKLFLPLRMELSLSILMVIILGINAFYATALDGPAAKVGDLYYSIWIAFVLSMRITLGCLEETLDHHDEVNINNNNLGNDKHKHHRWLSRDHFNFKREVVTKVVMLSDSYALSFSPGRRDLNNSFSDADDVSLHSYYGGISIPEVSHLQTMYEEKAVVDEDGSRKKRLRRWGTLVIFASICMLSATDAAIHLAKGNLNSWQKFMIYCPFVVIIISSIMFLMCLGMRHYTFVDKFYVGGLTSALVSGLWLCNLLISLHSESAWAVNEIGEVQMANLYYFTWACIVTAGLNTSSYLKKQFNVKPKSITIILWMGIVKISFVVFGSCVDIFLSVRDRCLDVADGDNKTHFCERTKIGIVLGLFGMLVAFLISVYKTMIPSPSLKALYIEIGCSGFLSFVFAVGLGLITGIGGPGQHVGDLYYATWLAFMATICATAGIFEDICDMKRSKEIGKDIVCKLSSDEDDECRKAEMKHSWYRWRIDAS